jgi:type I restriction enzyme S subunit
MSNNLMRKEAIKVGKMVKLPESWAVKQIKETMDLESGVWGKEDESGYPVLRSTNFTKSGYIDFEEVTYRDIPDRKIDDKKLKKGDVLLEISGGGPKQPVGRVVFFDEKENEDYLFGNFVKRLRLKDKLSEENDPFYVFRFLERYYDIGQTETLQHQTTGIRNLDYRAYMSLPLPLPPLPEQKKIATILSSVDKSIEKTDEVIEETKELKKGLMQELLTKGIGHSEFKEVMLGPKKVTVPIKWNIYSMSEIIENTQLGTNLLGKEENKGIPLIKMGNLVKGGFNFDKLEKVKSNSEVEEIEEYLLEEGDFLFNTRNTPELVGKSATWRNDLEKAIFNNNIMRIHFNDFISSYYMSYYFESKIGWDSLKRIVSGTTSVAAIYKKDLLNAKVVIPSLEEQKKIASILSSVDNKIKKEEEYKSKLERLKKGLMQKLLTGEIRVNTEMEV